MWIALKAKFGGTTVTWLRAGIEIWYLKGVAWWFHVRASEENDLQVEAARNNLTNEQKIEAMIHSFPNSWEKMKLNMTHNERIQKLKDLSCNLELKAERRVV